MNRINKKGFTLIELVLVIGILGLLLAITIVAINPAKQFAQANNTKRRSDVNAVLNAITQYIAGNKGVLPAGIDTTVRTITNNTTITNRVDLCAILVPTYIAALPVDPGTNNGNPVNTCTDSYNSDYTVVKSSASNRLTVSAPNAQNSETITVTR